MEAISDTHTFLWYILKDQRLSSKALATIEHAVEHNTHIGISAITIVEIIYLINKSRIPTSVLTIVQKAVAQPTSVIQIVPLGADIAYTVEQISRIDIPDMPDRIIAATALWYQLPLITRDGKIRSSSLTTIW